jgi:hypothetical protein
MTGRYGSRLFRVLRLLLVTLGLIAITLTTAWASLALWYRMPAPDIAQGLAASLLEGRHRGDGTLGNAQLRRL